MNEPNPDRQTLQEVRQLLNGVQQAITSLQRQCNTVNAGLADLRSEIRQHKAQEDNRFAHHSERTLEDIQALKMQLDALSAGVDQRFTEVHNFEVTYDESLHVVDTNVVELAERVDNLQGRLDARIDSAFDQIASVSNDLSYKADDRHDHPEYASNSHFPPGF